MLLFRNYYYYYYEYDIIDYLTVVAGAHYKDSDQGISEYEAVYNVSNVYIHEQYDGYFNYNDIALLELEPPIEFNDGVQPICLPPEGDDVYDYDRCVTTGWGNTFGTVNPFIYKHICI